jgi:hypothetical protein
VLKDTVYGWWQLQPDAAETRSRIGGAPDLADGELWPINARGIPLTFLAQIDTSTLEPHVAPWRPSTPWRHHDQLIRVFADLIDSPVAPCLTIALACSPAQQLRTVSRPATPEPWPSGGPYDAGTEQERYWDLPATAVRLVARLSAPETHPLLRPDPFDMTSATASAYERWLERLRRDGNELVETIPPPPPLHSLLEHASPDVIEDLDDVGAYIASEGNPHRPPGIVPVRAWTPFLSLYDDDDLGMQIADAGAFLVLAPADDLAEGVYDRMLCVPETA